MSETKGPDRLKPPEQAELVREITVSTGSPLAIPSSECEGWSRGLRLEGDGRALYTGCLYQAMAYSRRALKLLELMEGSDSAGKILRAASKLAAPLAVRLLKLAGGERRRYLDALRGIAKALKAAGVEPTPLKGDRYSGILLYELGYEEEFRSHIETLHKLLKDRGVEEVITVDPHTTEALRHAAPSTLKSWNVKVTHYLEVLADRMPPAEYPGRIKAALHDPCVLSRVLGLHGALRAVIARISGLEIVEPRRSGVKTFCCGGPVEFFRPSMAGHIARERLRELAATGASTVLVACPVCLSNLSRCAGGDLEIVDLGEILNEIF